MTQTQKLINYKPGGQFGAQWSNNTRTMTSGTGNEVDSYQLDYSDEITQILSKQAKKTLKQTFQLNQSFFCSKILFLVQYHPQDHSDSIYNLLCELVEDVHILSGHQSNLKNNKKLSGRMAGIGFRGGYKKGKSAGTYKVRKTLKPSHIELDKALLKKLPAHNQFIAHQFRHFSEAAFEPNKKSLEAFGIPSWSDESWDSYNKDPTPLASNVIVTTNDFSNKPHCDKDKNLFTYGLFSYINCSTGTPILPPADARGHAL
ncbi:hypothetical protein PtB15_2B714 [Puccinia triticina]|nr:hypothetical protein PtB15_2B714 [Puccinia triticina]